MSKIYISAGEASGDLLGADLCHSIRAHYPNAELIGMGGARMKQAGVKIIFDPSPLSIIGMTAIIKQLPKILWFFHRITQYIKKTKLDLVIMIDFPDTHLHLAKKIKKMGIPILFYVSPQIWAWRKNRIHKIKKRIDHMAVLFQFEEKIYRDANIPVTFVGHALTQSVKSSLHRDEAYRYFNLSSEKPIIVLFPGSRKTELKYHLPILVDASKKIAAQHDVQFVLALAPNFSSDILSLPENIRVAQDHHYDLLSIAHAAVAASGTVTLEIALMQTPCCIFYRFSTLNYFIARLLIRTKYIGLCNIVADHTVAQEWIQDEATPENIAHEINKLLDDKKYYAEKKAMLQNFQDYLSTTESASEIITTKIIPTLVRPH